MQNLSLTEQSFSSLRAHNCIYIDKTDQIHRLLTRFSKAYFISRPRRFGKSLLCDTLDCIFSGRKELFADLAISKTDYTWPVHPVIRLDFASMGKQTPEIFQHNFAKALALQGKRYGLEIELTTDLASMGNDLIRGLHEKTGAQVVLIVDEYDKPLLDYIEQPEIANQMRSVMKDFFDIIKPLTESIRLTFITGVGRFSLAGLSSGLNHMDDLSTDTRAATLLGYTQQEVEHYFGEYLAQHAATFPGGMPALLEEVKTWYNGYRFSKDEQRVYNPFSLMKFTSTGDFTNYWFTTGTPSFLIKLMAQSTHWRKRPNQATELLPEQLVIHEITGLSPSALLFQAGYLTIKDIVPPASSEESFAYALAYPNLEVKISMHSCVMAALTHASVTQASLLLRNLTVALRNANIDDFMQTMQTNFASIPYQIHPSEPNSIETKEHYYHSIFLAICQLLGFDVQAEVSTNRGRTDILITTNTHIFIFEIKVDKKAQEAIAQIKETQYAQRFTQSDKQVVLVGVSFDSTKRNIAEWLSQEVA